MRALEFVGTVCIFCVGSISVSAQQAVPTSALPTTSDPQAVALLQRSLVAIANGVPVADVTLIGTARRIAGSDDENGTATLTALASGGSKVSLDFPSGNRTEIRNPAGIPLADSMPAGMAANSISAAQPVGAWSGPDGVRHGISRHNLLIDDAWFVPVLTIGRLLAPGNYQVSYLGQETHNGQNVVHLAAVQPSSDDRPTIAALEQHLSQMDAFLDPSTQLPVALEFNAHPDQNAVVDIAVEIRFSDYRSVQGVQIPFHVQKYLNGALALDMQFDNSNINSGIAATAFQIQ